MTVVLIIDELSTVKALTYEKTAAKSKSVNLFKHSIAETKSRMMSFKGSATDQNGTRSKTTRHIQIEKVAITSPGDF